MIGPPEEWCWPKVWGGVEPYRPRPRPWVTLQSAVLTCRIPTLFGLKSGLRDGWNGCSTTRALVDLLTELVLLGLEGVEADLSTLRTSLGGMAPALARPLLGAASHATACPGC